MWNSFPLYLKHLAHRIPTMDMDEWLLLDQWMISPHAECCRLDDMRRVPGIREMFAALGHENYGFWRKNGQSFDEAAENYKKFLKNPVDWGNTLPPLQIPVNHDPLIPFPRIGEEIKCTFEVEKAPVKGEKMLN